MRRFMLALSTCLGLIAAPVTADAAEDGAEVVSCNGCEALLELAAATPARKDDRARDVYRHPVETLKFMGVAPDMKVGEYAPGGGWYSRMLAPYLAEEGHLTGLYFNPDVVPFDGSKLAESAAAFPGKVVEWTGVDPDSVSGMTLKDIPDAEKGSYDRIVLFRMLHNMMNWNIADSEIKAMRTLLKDDGLLGVVQHRAKADAPFSYTNGSKGYLRQADVVRLMELNGFELVASSEINANAKDPANWEGGVWTLPPQFALKEQDKAKYAAIGESDRMTLLFRKRD
ncbi:class I SAM-dependent methyltransferase [Novosphingobium decolorationis]|uniref:Class I SAM-dependent methyltransferase n=1 Tax=Novosphingobium decolorationis TaxID=2698673 RepID=A0ABX8E526_9SPHN|nr:methyltransferase [Novosphingobium decolorationis]QVM83151.1 class I SAM-dependent methyltransferase [Novosphingobium decolorationis]